jgi:hypothetical protein
VQGVRSEILNGLGELVTKVRIQPRDREWITSTGKIAKESIVNNPDPTPKASPATLLTELNCEQTAAIAGGRRYYGYSPCNYGGYYSARSYSSRRTASFEVAASRLDAALFQ